MTIHNDVTDISTGSKIIGVYYSKYFLCLKKSTNVFIHLALNPRSYLSLSSCLGKIVQDE